MKITTEYLHIVKSGPVTTIWLPRECRSDRTDPVSELMTTKNMFTETNPRECLVCGDRSSVDVGGYARVRDVNNVKNVLPRYSHFMGD
ncbi:unnamed protein product, partial [Medioppia subpectinata]